LSDTKRSLAGTADKYTDNNSTPIILVDFASIFEYNANMSAKSTITTQIISTPFPLTYDYLKERYKDYHSPKDKISRLAAEGTLIRLKKGFYLPATDNKPTELVANLLLGPSYVSLETALSYYGMIPERVYAVRSVTTKRSKAYKTPIGRFEYLTVKEGYFSVGVRSASNEFYRFLIASPEKAICDMIALTPGLKIQSLKAMREYIEEDIRIDLPEEVSLDVSVIKRVAETGVKRREMSFLLEYCAGAK